MKNTLASITLIVTTYLVIGFTCHAMDSDVSTIPPKNRKKTTQEILKSLHNAHTRNDETTFKNILFSKSPEELKPILPQLQGITSFRTPEDKSKPESNSAFNKIVYTYAEEKNIHKQAQDAIRHQDLIKVTNLVTDENINLQNLIGQTPLHFTIRCNQLAIARMLLAKKKADVCLSDYAGITPLHLAQCTEMVELLLQHQAPLNQQDISGQTPLFEAILNQRADVADLLIAKGADVNLASMHGVTPLHMVTNVFNDEIAAALGEKLLAAGANVNALNNNQTTPLLLAATWRLPKLVGLLLTHGADATYTDTSNISAASIIQDEWNLSPNQFLELYKNPKNFEAYIKKQNRDRAQKSFEISVPKRETKLKKDKKKKANKNTQTFEQRKQKAALVAHKIATTKDALKPTKQVLPTAEQPVTTNTPALVLAERVTKWKNAQWLKEEKQKAKIAGVYQYWQFKRKRLYHQLPEKTLNTLLKCGKPEPRPNKTYEGQMDTQYTLEGEMQFEYLTNPWNPGKQRQPGYYHITRGIDDKIYHVGFKPIQERGLRLSDFMAQGQIPVEWADAETSSYSAVYDPREGVRHVLYTN